MSLETQTQRLVETLRDLGGAAGNQRLRGQLPTKQDDGDRAALEAISEM